MAPPPAAIDCGRFNSTLNLAYRNNTASLLLDRCAGNRKTEVLTIYRPTPTVARVVATPTPTRPSPLFVVQHPCDPASGRWQADPAPRFTADYIAGPTPTPRTVHGPVAPQAPRPTPAPQYQRRDISHERRNDCEGDSCPTETKFEEKVKTVHKGQPHSTCHTKYRTETVWKTELHEWVKTVYPYVVTDWVYEPTPLVHTAEKTVWFETVHPARPTGSTDCKTDCHPQGGGDDGHQDGWDEWWKTHRPHGSLVPPLTGTQIVTLVLIPVFLVFDLFVWPIHILALIFLLPFQMYTNLVHEIFHLAAGVLGGATVCSVTIDPGCGPQSIMRNGSPLFTLLMGYIGSQIIGGFYVCLAFDERASKITYLIHAPLWPAVFWFTVGIWPKIQILVVVGFSISLWFIWEARFLRIYMLFMGLLSLYYVLWDVVDDFFFHKQNESDASILARVVPSVKAGVWAILFLFTASGVLTCAIIAGLHFFHGDIHQASQRFLPT